jgi:hypothetical protein
LLEEIFHTLLSRWQPLGVVGGLFGIAVIVCFLMC